MDNSDLIYFERELGVLPKDGLDQTFIINLVKKNYDEIDFEKADATKFIYGVSLLEYYLKQNFATFEITEDIYRFAKYICEKRNDLRNLWRSELRIREISFRDWLINKGYVNKMGVSY